MSNGDVSFDTKLTVATQVHVYFLSVTAHSPWLNLETSGARRKQGNFLRPMARDSMEVVAGPAENSLDALARCIRGRDIHTMTTCGE